LDAAFFHSARRQPAFHPSGIPAVSRDMSKAKPAPLEPDTQVGGYRVLRKLASGGFGVVYLALTADGQRVAVKEYLPASLVERGAGEMVPIAHPEKLALYRLGLKSFFEEGRSLAQISHPSVVGVLNFFRENETVYMVMNYLEGSSLQEFVITARELKRKKIFRESTIRSLYDEILQGLRVVHQHKMLHLDIKPAKSVHHRTTTSPSSSTSALHAKCLASKTSDFGRCTPPALLRPRCTSATLPSAPGQTSIRWAPASMHP
jgi:serine/threonine protein kinase